jgi:hypothetical protein
MPMVSRAEKMPGQPKDGAVPRVIERLDAGESRSEVRRMVLYVFLQFVFGIARSGNQCLTGMVESADDAMHEFIVDRMLRTVFMIGKMMATLRGRMQEAELDFIIGAEVEHLGFAAVDEDDCIMIFAHGSCPVGRLIGRIDGDADRDRYALVTLTHEMGRRLFVGTRAERVDLTAWTFDVG